MDRQAPEHCGPQAPARRLELLTDDALQHRVWAVQRIGWGVMALVLAAALAGLFDSGPLGSVTKVEARQSLVLEYGLFARYGTEESMTIRFAEAARFGQEIRLWISQDFLRDVEVQRMMPLAEDIRFAEGGLVFVFPSDPAVTAGEIKLSAVPQEIGVIQGAISVNGGPPIAFTQFVYP